MKTWHPLRASLLSSDDVSWFSSHSRRSPFPFLSRCQVPCLSAPVNICQRLRVHQSVIVCVRVVRVRVRLTVHDCVWPCVSSVCLSICPCGLCLFSSLSLLTTPFYHFCPCLAIHVFSCRCLSFALCLSVCACVSVDGRCLSAQSSLSSLSSFLSFPISL